MSQSHEPNAPNDYRQNQGALGEELAAQYLQKKGFSVLSKRYRTRWGEIDLILKRKTSLVFVEVKARQNENYGHPLEAITARKRRHLLKAAQSFLQRFPEYRRNYDCHFLAVGILLGGRRPKIEVLPIPLGQMKGNWS